MRSKADNWVIQGQHLSDRVARNLVELFLTVWFWIALLVLAASALGIKYWNSFKLQLDIWRLRRSHGEGSVDQSVVEELFYRATRLAEKRLPRRRPAETWREWVSALPDPGRRSMLAQALTVFEKTKYGQLPASTADFALMEATLRELKL
jgi:hypothetical protein